MADFGANVGAGILAQGVPGIVKGLYTLVTSEIALAWGVNDELRKLKKTLHTILVVLDDAEKKQVNSEAVRLWLEELKDIAYEAEDILDEHAYEVLRQQQAMTRKRDRVSNYILPHSNPILFRRKIARDIENINKNLNQLAMHKLGLHLKELNLNQYLDESAKLRELRETFSSVDPSLKIIGRDKDKSNIIEMLLKNDPQNQDGNIQVIPIVGMGGLGKTTLAKEVFNNKTVEKNFDLKIWVCVSDDFNLGKLFKKIIESITKKNLSHDGSNIEVMIGHLRELLSGEKYLLVLDDVWNENPQLWETLRNPLMVGSNGTRILVTTRSDDVASIMGGKPYSYKLGILNEDDSWYLFHKQTFGYSGAPLETPALTAIGKQLVKKCEGLPLAIVFLISLLRYKDENEWSAINKSKIWNESSSDEDKIKVLPILKLSYDHLPSHLKQCFAYFSIFIPDCLYNAMDIIQMWMAEGFLPQPSGGNNLSMEEVGNKYLNSLLRNSFFQDVEKDEYGQIMSFSMHDLVHDLAKHVAGDRECLIWGPEDGEIDNILSVRRLRLFSGAERPSFNEIMANFRNKSKLRTLSVFDESVQKIEKNAFDGTERLRVLDLSHAPEMEEIPSASMSNLKHLRYLKLSGTKITKLPKSVTKLFHLQTLVLYACVNLKKLPKDIGKLINLRHLLLSKDINLPREIGQLSSLQTLFTFNVVGKCGIEVLEGLNLLNGFIKINHLENVTSEIDVQRANLKGKKNLNDIYLNWHTDPDGDDAAARDFDCDHDKDEAVLEALQPHPTLKVLDIDQYFGAKLPRWMGDSSCLPNLVFLQLSNCLVCEQLVGFGKLPSLKELILINMIGIECIGNEFYYNNSSGGGGGEVVLLFPSLKKLVLSGMYCLEEWVDITPPAPTVVANYSCFPCLEEIKIRGCPNLRITPTTHFPSLKKLILEEINERVAVPLITTNLQNSLQIVELKKITELKFLPHSLLQGSNICDLKVTDCLDFQGFLPDDDEEEEEEEEEEEGLQQQQQQAQSSSLQVLSLLRLPALKFLPDIRSFTSLEELYIKDCESFIKPCLSSLEHMKVVEIQNVKEVDDFEWHA